MSNQSPAVDITSLYGVESLFRDGTRDPWGAKLAGRFADFFIFNDTARFTMPVRGDAVSLTDPSLPPILTQLRSRDSGILEPIPYVLDERRTLNPQYLQPAFASFAAWAENNRGALTNWLGLHSELRLDPGAFSRVRPQSVFDTDALRTTLEFAQALARLNLSEQDLMYAFDIVLRYPLYGQLVGSGTYFLAHPIREQQGRPIISVEPGPAPALPLSLSQVVAAMAPSMNMDEYTSFLHEARGLIRDRKIHRLQPGAIDRETTRELASQLGLPARISKAGRVIGIAAGVIGIAGAVPTLGAAAAVAGGLVSMVSAAWTGTVGRAPARITWLRWALEWDLERQASDSA